MTASRGNRLEPGARLAADDKSNELAALSDTVARLENVAAQLFSMINETHDIAATVWCAGAAPAGARHLIDLGKALERDSAAGAKPSTPAKRPVNSRLKVVK